MGLEYGILTPQKAVPGSKVGDFTAPRPHLASSRSLVHYSINSTRSSTNQSTEKAMWEVKLGFPRVIFTGLYEGPIVQI